MLMPGLRAIVADRGYTGPPGTRDQPGLALDIKRPPALQPLPAMPGRKPKKPKRVFTPLTPLYKVENAFARLGHVAEAVALIRADRGRREDLDGGRLRRLLVWAAQDRANLTRRTSGSSRMPIVPRSAARMMAVANA